MSVRALGAIMNRAFILLPLLLLPACAAAVVPVPLPAPSKSNYSMADQPAEVAAANGAVEGS